MVPLYNCSYPRGPGIGVVCIDYQFVYFSYAFEDREMATRWSMDLADSLRARHGPDLPLSLAPYILHSNQDPYRCFRLPDININTDPVSKLLKIFIYSFVPRVHLPE